MPAATTSPHALLPPIAGSPIGVEYAAQRVPLLLRLASTLLRPQRPRWRSRCGRWRERRWTARCQLTAITANLQALFDTRTAHPCSAEKRRSRCCQCCRICSLNASVAVKSPRIGAVVCMGQMSGPHTMHCCPCAHEAHWHMTPYTRRPQCMCCPCKYAQQLKPQPKSQHKLQAALNPQRSAKRVWWRD